MPSWIFISLQLALLIAVCSSTETHEEHVGLDFKLSDSEELKGLDLSEGLGAVEGLGEESDTTHHGKDHGHATSYQSFYLESKNAVPVVLKKEHHYETIPEHHQFEEMSHGLELGHEGETHFTFHGDGHER